MSDQVFERLLRFSSLWDIKFALFSIPVVVFDLIVPRGIRSMQLAVFECRDRTAWIPF